jgi:hypothetical protein
LTGAFPLPSRSLAQCGFALFAARRVELIAWGPKGFWVPFYNILTTPSDGPALIEQFHTGNVALVSIGDAKLFGILSA